MEKLNWFKRLFGLYKTMERIHGKCLNPKCGKEFYYDIEIGEHYGFYGCPYCDYDKISSILFIKKEIIRK